ncbi:MAG: hypothetical protein AABN95_25625, partial [Acidobacteriota bacterium]
HRDTEFTEIAQRVKGYPDDSNGVAPVPSKSDTSVNQCLPMPLEPDTTPLGLNIVRLFYPG